MFENILPESLWHGGVKSATRATQAETDEFIARALKRRAEYMKFLSKSRKGKSSLLSGGPLVNPATKRVVGFVSPLEGAKLLEDELRLYLLAADHDG